MDSFSKFFKNIFSAFVSFLEVFIEFVTILFLFHVSVFWPGGMWDLSCLTRDEPTPTALEGKVLITGLPGKSLFFFFKFSVLGLSCGTWDLVP